MLATNDLLHEGIWKTFYKRDFFVNSLGAMFAESQGLVSVVARSTKKENNVTYCGSGHGVSSPGPARISQWGPKCAHFGVNYCSTRASRFTHYKPSIVLLWTPVLKACEFPAGNSLGAPAYCNRHADN